MGICGSVEDKANRDKSINIDKELELHAKVLKKECKILLLGSGESGKSTIVKQMKIIHMNGYSKESLIAFRSGIHKNVIESIYALLHASSRLGVEYVDPKNKEYAEAILAMKLDSEPQPRLNAELAHFIRSIWADEASQKVMNRTNEFYIMDSAPYFLENVERIGKADYIPNQDDVLRARVKTTGITETRFQMGQLNIHMVDVGGQRSERKKWIHCFEAVTSIIFCVALSEYDQVLLEESAQNRMAESLVLFESVINSRWFLRTSIILFLNKIDIFKEKLKKSPLSNYFPEYAGGDDLNKAAKFMLWRFQQLNRARVNVYPHLTCATDTGQIRLVFAAVKETILQNALKDSGIL